MADGAPRRRPRLVRPGAALAVAAIIVAMMASTGLITSANHQQIKLSDLGQVAAFLAFAAVGVVVAWHQPRNPMGWVLLGVSFFFLLDDLASSYAYLDYRLHGGRLPIGWLAVLLAPSWAPAVVLAGLSLLLFPDGRVPSSRWRPMLWAYLALGALWLGGCFRHLARRGHKRSGQDRCQRRPGRVGLPERIDCLVGRGTGGLLPRGRGLLASLANRAGAELPALIRRSSPAIEVAAKRGVGGPGRT
jgi:hypothetical protein